MPARKRNDELVLSQRAALLLLIAFVAAAVTVGLSVAAGWIWPLALLLGGCAGAQTYRLALRSIGR